MKIVNYLLESGGKLNLGQVEAPRGAFDDHVAPIQAALEKERENTVAIGQALRYCARDPRSRE